MNILISPELKSVESWRIRKAVVEWGSEGASFPRIKNVVKEWKDRVLKKIARVVKDGVRGYEMSKKDGCRVRGKKSIEKEEK